MSKKALETLTESMFYVLMALRHADLCGTEIAEAVERKTGGRVRLGPGTLYTLLGSFGEKRLIEEIALDGRKRTYHITAKGIGAYEDELTRLRQCVADADKEAAP
ncbi:MAG TPA: helix-turn-helix transcriptional regulator [Oscillospiraceae bacterium]|nr:helix-turn-helix transcriptional regulator [Oscillospiraceae bacterium]HNX99285.1 helix-turn-helix transcriptional regulator [Oscillospiraceae bacterium]HPS76260.1 helix-turn-helix transcriptional regulator [Oscillospiraceae bacterium]